MRFNAQDKVFIAVSYRSGGEVSRTTDDAFDDTTG